MNEDTKLEIPTEGDAPDLSDDDIAAALGYHTTLSEPLVKDMSAMEAGDQQDGEQQDTSQENATHKPASPTANHDDEQDAEIEDIRTQLEALQKELQNEQSGQTTESTATPQ